MPDDPRVDTYIDGAAPFARPILAHLRAIVHAACPDVAETIKWGRPFFVAHGRPLAFVAAFKAHAAFGFWHGTETGREAEGAGQFGRLTSLADLPPDADLVALIQSAAAGATQAAPRPAPRAVPDVPADLAAALADDPAGRAAFDRLPPSRRREHIEAVLGAKRAETRARRVALVVERLMPDG